jgi:hypothetical protein
MNLSYNKHDFKIYQKKKIIYMISKFTKNNNNMHNITTTIKLNFEFFYTLQTQLKLNFSSK